jgi:hypothetical protein
MVEFGHKVLWEYCAQSAHSKSYDSLTPTKLTAIRQSAEERYLAYLFLINSGAQHELLGKELQNDFTKGSDKYPEIAADPVLQVVPQVLPRLIPRSQNLRTPPRSLPYKGDYRKNKCRD